MTVRGYDDKIAKLEEELRQTKPSVEHSLVLEALTVQLRDVEETLERKTKNLETLHANSSASLVCSSPSEDISVNSPSHRKKSAENSSIPPLPVDEVQRIFDKLHRHTRVEEVAIKRINDLEMQICSVRNEYAVSTYNFVTELENALPNVQININIQTSTYKLWFQFFKSLHCLTFVWICYSSQIFAIV